MAHLNLSCQVPRRVCLHPLQCQCLRLRLVPPLVRLGVRGGVNKTTGNPFKKSKPNPEAFVLNLHPDQEDFDIMSTVGNNNNTNLGTKQTDRSSLGVSIYPSTFEVNRTKNALAPRSTADLSGFSKPRSSTTFTSSDVRERGLHNVHLTGLGWN